VGGDEQRGAEKRDGDAQRLVGRHTQADVIVKPAAGRGEQVDAPGEGVVSTAQPSAPSTGVVGPVVSGDFAPANGPLGSRLGVSRGPLGSTEPATSRITPPPRAVRVP
jgi:hypothetical protein